MARRVVVIIYHIASWCREPWIASLDLVAVLPPPEKGKDIRAVIGAARAKQGAAGDAVVS